ncbi:chaperone modulator CbpM [Pseudoroseomonas cervicalis]|uniref:chaperone modulator CbpM n=1 Tax=Teichococcus cervicalis TaxID=204525 RepID=UPI0022F14B99|nr:chaperone modulator CbpM [Pseudoroseomonas cervicalis]WBV43478.1 hypothetical protein PFY06_02610 [Pseudoroseomonas cervicalis]
MIRHEDFLLQSGLGESTLQLWVAEGWLSSEPERPAAELARAALIRELTEELGVNTEGVDVALRLLDQLHGLRAALRAVLEGLPVEARAAALLSLRGGLE